MNKSFLVILWIVFLLGCLGQSLAQSGGFPASLTGPLASERLSVGEFRILYIPVTFLDRHDLPITSVEARAMLAEVAEFYAESSFGRLTLLPTVTPGITLPHSAAWYEQRDANIGVNGNMDSRQVMHEHARNEARKLGYDADDYDLVILRQDSELTNNASTNQGRLWLGNNSAQTTAHEIGHILGLNHANAWNTSGTSVAGPGTDEEYAHLFDIMGLYSVPFPQGQFNAAAKSQLGWLPEVASQEITQSGIYRIQAMDQGRMEAGKRYALKIVKDAQRTYWGEVRTLFDDNPWVAQGMVLAWHFPNGGTGNAQLLDTHPASPFGLADAPLSLGRTFSDLDAGIHMTVLAVNDSPRWVEVKVNLGDFLENQKPTSLLTASALAVPVGGTVTFTMQATDADGDELAYDWQHLGDLADQRVSPNTPVITRTFNTAGRFVVACTASDMKGGTSTRFAEITVGGGNGRRVIRGRITQGGVGIGGLAVTANAANGTITDSDGYYAIPNLAAGSYVITPLQQGYQFQSQFTNPVSLGADYAGADFKAEALPVVTLTSVGERSDESGVGTPARFVLSRSQPPHGDLQVKLNAPQGTAISGTDYTLSPALETGAPFYSVTIPNGQSSLEIQVLPVADALVEGAETVRLKLVADYGYQLGTNQASVEIADDDTAQQRVSVKPVKASLSEGEAGGGFVFTRTGDVSMGLNVTLDVSGSASPGMDFMALPTGVTFEPGMAQVSLALETLDDSVAEDLEEVTVTVMTSAEVLPDPVESVATVMLVDDDLPVLSLTAADAEATEGLDTGTFVVSRAGDASQSLTIYYSVSGTAFHGEDYQPLPGVVTLAAGIKEVAITVLPIAEGWGEGDETVSLRLAAAPESYALGDTSSATVVIHDAAADKPTVGVTPTLAPEEGTSNGRFTVSVKGGSPGPLTVRYQISGSATAGTDYLISGLNNTTLEGTVTLILPADGAAQHNLTLQVINDSTEEDLESVIWTLIEDTSYQISDQAAEAALWITDNDKPVVYADIQVGSNLAVSSAATEGAALPVVVYFSRNGSLTSSLEVNYTLSGTAENGTDYGTLSGTVTIPVGAVGVEQAISIINDLLVEGSETLEVNVVGTQSYTAGQSAVLTILDNDVSTQTVSFMNRIGVANEGEGTVEIPVTLGASAAETTMVEYAVASSATSSQATRTTLDFPLWVRVVRTEEGFYFYQSNNGVNWGSPLRSVISASMSSSFYLVGLCVGSGVSGSSCTAVFDNVSVTGLESGSSVTSNAVSVNVGAASPAGGSVKSGSTYTVTGGGPGMAKYNTTNPDRIRFVYFTVSHSRSCTITARVNSMTGGGSGAKAGVMIRETTDDESTQLSQTAVPGGGSTYNYRYTITNPISNGALRSGILRPFWLGVRRQGDWVTSLRSNDGTNWITTESLYLTGLADRVHAGLAVSSKSSASLGTAVFDQVSLESGSGLTLVNSSIGATPSGSYSVTSGSHTLKGGGLGISDESDSFEFASQELEGDFMLKARLLSQSGGTTASQAGVMLRELDTTTSRMMFMGSVGTSSSPTYISLSRIGKKSGAVGNGVDYVLTPGVLEFMPGEQVKNISVLLLDDVIREPSESFSIQLLNPFKSWLGTNPQHTLVILDNDLPPAVPAVSFAAASSSANEADGMVDVQVVLSQVSAVPVMVDYAVTGGSAASGDDFLLPAGTLTFSPGETVKSLSVTVVDDGLIETDETVQMAISNPVGATTGPILSHELTLHDNDLPVVILAATDAVASEGGDTARFVVSRSGPTNDTLEVTLSSLGTATAGADYTTLPSVITLPVGQAEVEILVTPLQDSLNEGTETVSLALVAGNDYQVGQVSSAEVVILDDDRSIISLSSEVGTTVSEGGASGGWTLMREGSVSGSLQVNLSYTGTAVNGVDYAVQPVSVLFADGQSSLNVPCLPLEDDLAEGTEAAVAVLLAGNYDRLGDGYATILIEDNDAAPVVRILSPVSSGQIIAAGNGLMIAASVTDDGLPQPLTTQWSQVSGPGTATFDDAAEASTGVVFSVPGTYVLRLSAQDGRFTSTAELTVKSQSSDVGDWQLRNIGTVTNPAPTVTDTAGTITLAGAGRLDIAVVDQAYDSPSTGAFYARSFVGDFVATVKHGTATSSASRARSGLMLRASTDPYAPYAHVGRVPQSAYDGFLWRTTQAGLKDGVSGYSGTERWLRLIRRGNTVTAFHAANMGGVPGSWTQLGPPQSVVLPDEVQVGLFVDNNLGSGLNTVVFTDFNIEPLNQAPAVTIAAPVAYAVTPISLSGTVNDDGLPEPASLNTRWSQVAGPNGMVFDPVTTLATTATLTQFGSYKVRLQADDGAVETFQDLRFDGHRYEFESWLSQHFIGGPGSVDGGYTADPDHDGLNNLEEYAYGFDPLVPSRLETVGDLVTLQGEQYLRLTIYKNGNAPGVLYGGEITDDIGSVLSWDDHEVIVELNTPDLLQVRDAQPVTSRIRRFLRARLTLEE